jgi:hypothetical protein
MKRLVILLSWLPVVACKKNPEPPAPSLLAQPTASVTAAPVNPHAAAPVSSLTPPAALPIDVTWEDPSEWKRLSTTNPMRKATYLVPRAKGDTEDGELAVFYFGPGQGGSIDDNVKRWVGQFKDLKPDSVKRADREANGLKQHTVEIETGTFSSGMPGGPTKPKSDYGLLGGIVSSPSGVYFFKLTGPRATVKAAHAPFYKLLDSVKATS